MRQTVSAARLNVIALIGVVLGLSLTLAGSQYFETALASIAPPNLGPWSRLIAPLPVFSILGLLLLLVLGGPPRGREQKTLFLTLAVFAVLGAWVVASEWFGLCVG